MTKTFSAEELISAINSANSLEELKRMVAPGNQIQSNGSIEKEGTAAVAKPDTRPPMPLQWEIIAVTAVFMCGIVYAIGMIITMISLFCIAYWILYSDKDAIVNSVMWTVGSCAVAFIFLNIGAAVDNLAKPYQRRNWL